MTPPEARTASPNSRASILWLNLYFWSAVPVVTAIFVIGAAVYAGIFLLIFRNRRRGKWLVRRSISHYGRWF